MTPETITTFLSGYLHSLREETRAEKSGVKHGFDHIILKLAEADNLVPLRLAFHRGGRSGTPKPKKEHEFGEDLKVISRDGAHLTIYVLKDEPLTYKSWITEGFEKDMTLAVAQDLSSPELRRVREVRVVLAYNKDDEARGVEAFEKFAKSRPPKVGKTAKLVLERWNLTDLTEKVRSRLVDSPAILPEQFFRSFSYICWQAEDFTHGSEQWREVLIPDWLEFLKSILHDKAGEREVRMVTMSLIVLRNHGKAAPSWETGWIELVEWAMLALWHTAAQSKDKKAQSAVWTAWVNLYLAQLEAYYEKHGALLLAKDSLACGHHAEFTEAIASHHAYWHMGRLGILGTAVLQMADGVDSDGSKKALMTACQKVVNTVIGMINANPACLRPMLDIHHIELFLVWLLLSAVGLSQEALAIFVQIHERLVLRRLGKGGVRLIDQNNSWPLLLEHIATGEPLSENFGKSSYLLQMVIELCVCKLGVQGEELAWEFFQHLILGQLDGGESMGFTESVELQSWIPPAGWRQEVLEKPLGHEGSCLTIRYGTVNPVTRDEFSAEVRNFVNKTNEAHPIKKPQLVPFGASVLGCIMHKSPLPPEMWREAFRESGKTTKRNRTRPNESRRAPEIKP